MFCAWVWVISIPRGTKRTTVGGVVICANMDQISYRHELGEQLGIAASLDSFQLTFTNYSITIVCNGITALNRVEMDTEHIKISYDEIVGIWTKKTRLLVL